MDTRVWKSMSEAFRVLETRFVFADTGLLLNYTDLDGAVPLPTAEECGLGMPNHNAWNTPVEDGAYYGGLYLDALLNLARAGMAGASEAADRVARGLVSLAVNGGADGFVARGYVGSPQTHYAMGSNDQTFPWLYGLWRYARDESREAGLRAACAQRIRAVAEALHARQYRIPSDPQSLGDRGDYCRATACDAAKLLFLQRALADLTGEAAWLERYRRALAERMPDGRARLEWVAGGAGFAPYDGASVFYCLAGGEGMEEVFGRPARILTRQLFTEGMAAMALRALAEMEDDPAIRDAYRQGLVRDASACGSHLIRREGFDLAAAPRYSGNWRAMNALWVPQRSVEDTHRLCWRQMPVWFAECPRFPYENAFVREPLFAGYILALAGDPALRRQWEPEVEATLLHYPWARLHTATMYAALSLYGQWLRDEEGLDR